MLPPKIKPPAKNKKSLSPAPWACPKKKWKKPKLKRINTKQRTKRKRPSSTPKTWLTASSSPLKKLLKTPETKFRKMLKKKSKPKSKPLTKSKTRTTKTPLKRPPKISPTPRKKSVRPCTKTAKKLRSQKAKGQPQKAIKPVRVATPA